MGVEQSHVAGVNELKQACGMQVGRPAKAGRPFSDPFPDAPVHYRLMDYLISFNLDFIHI
jgi:hypothetical protein